MSWKQEIFRAILLSVGAIEVFTNTLFLFKPKGLLLARKQHQELPMNISENKIRLKVVGMLLFGMAFFIVALVSYILHGYLESATLAVLVLFSLYGVSEALYYKYWKTSGFALVTILLLAAFIFV